MTKRARLPLGIWALGLVSMFMDISSEMIHALLPAYLTVGLGATALAVGFIEGVAEATALIVKVFSGVISDKLGRRKGLALLGYGLAAVTKPVFPLAGSMGWIVAARFIDRIGKGIRGAPRDALVADLTTPDQRGAAYGLRQTMDTIGAFLGPLVAIFLMWIFAGHFQSVFWIAVIPAFIAVLLLWALVRDSDTPVEKRGNPLSRSALAELPRAYWSVVVLAAVFTLARFSEAFLILLAQDTGLPLMWLPLVLVAMNVVYAVSAYPIGVLSDRTGPRGLLGIGVAILVLADVALACGGYIGLSVGVLLWGLHMGMTQGLMAKLVADAAPANLRGTAFGMCNLVSGIAALVASVVAGALWQWYGPAATFVAGAVFAATSGLGILRIGR